MASTPGVPPLPPRHPRTTTSQSGNYSSSALLPSSDDPRRSSTQSLLPQEPYTVEKRTLLLIYIHGFMGTETSFRSFPAHVHNLVTITLADSHVVHTKIYPRYRSRRTIEQVAEDFSKWLSPHESADTDVILLSHSMGGLVATEVELLPADTITAGHTFRHRIIGNINFDVPYLGMHPGVVGTGLGSVFQTAPQPTEPLHDADGSTLSTVSSITADSLSTESSNRPSLQDTLFSPPTDPNFNPKFANDVILPVRRGWQNAVHFVNKHSDNLRKATKQLVKSHMEFGGAMADYSALRSRYTKIRALEDEDVTVRKRLAGQSEDPPRLRFVNYYTASTGRKKREKSRSRSRSRSRSPCDPHLCSITPLGQSLHSSSLSTQSVNSQSLSLSQCISVEEHVGSSDIYKGGLDLRSPVGEATTAAAFNSGHQESFEIDSSTTSVHVQMPNLPPLPPPPIEPMLVDLTPYPDEEARKIICKENDRQLRAYRQALADREEAIRDRKELEDKLRRLAIAKHKEERTKACQDSPALDQEMALAIKKSNSTEGELLQTERLKGGTAETESLRESGPSTCDSNQMSLDHLAMIPTEEKQKLPAVQKAGGEVKKDRKFCILPKKINGERDPLWVRVCMDGHDEVSAHTGLFFLSDTYEKLVGDVVARIEEWVRDDMTRRMIDEFKR
ncbi:uncharacterized protein PV09_07299 [Verruconis gallopava]|uniref:DUF676 domain-containing protein n=1 Tax=Verruconis gallopava TaxID=253628 RepID=A0A0D2A464_9PEZI|nr:uncharacterized protein PV09_07299 [Verruconis gallopava]KIW01260.1 hypothetical protein PV09_07299 [Verruconis gallopava]